MAPNIPDHWLWLGLGVFTFIAIKQVSQGLHTIRALTELPNPPPSSIPSPAPTHQEDAIKTDSLLTLATSHNIDIRSSATRILCNRFYASAPARKALIRDLNSKDEEVKRRAQLAFNLLCEMGIWLEYSVPPPTPRGAWRLLGQREWGVRRETADRDLRRRRREAMVIHEGDGAVGREDVYMRNREGRMSSEEIGVEYERSRSEELLSELVTEQ